MSKTNFRQFISKYGIHLVLLFLIVFFSFTSEAFFTTKNLFNIMRQVAVVGIISVGMTFVIIIGGIDLSVGSILAICGVLLSKILVSGAGYAATAAMLLAVIAVLSVTIGMINGFFVNNLGLPAFVSTLGMMTALRGMGFIITNGKTVFGFPEWFRIFGQGFVWVIPVPVIFMMLAFLMGYILLNKTKYGRYIYAIGGNEEAARLSGIDVKKVRYLVYVLSAALSTIAGFVLLSRVNSGHPKAGEGYELDVITAVILGGVSITGGEGKISGVLIGVLILGVLSNGLVLLNTNEYAQDFLKGLVLLAAVSFDRFVQKNKATA
jgi:ribose/xylose/arabinose/galactoside ABC-type transport system permease subunit